MRETEAIEFEGSEHSETTGGYPYGGVVHTIHGKSAERPFGLVFDFGETGRIEVAFADWRRVGEHELPFLAIIDDGDRVFDYRYTSIDLEPQSPFWFYDALPAPAIDAVQIHRLHRKLLAAHCLGDAALMAELTAPGVFSASRGQRDRFGPAAFVANRHRGSAYSRPVSPQDYSESAGMCHYWRVIMVRAAI